MTLSRTLLPLLLLAPSLTFAQPSPAKPRVVLVELFTSEGCSSCPPADKQLRQIDQKQINPGQLIVGISEHVTYWNQLGWADPFSSLDYTARQEAYANHFSLESVYTPQMVVNGAHQFVGGDSSSLLKALQQEMRDSEPIAVQILSVTAQGNELVVHYAVDGKFPAHGADLLAVIADDVDQSSVNRGENSGRTLTHVAVARSLSRVAQLKAAADASVTIPLPKSYRKSEPHHFILFAQTPGNGRVLGTDTKPL